MPNDTIPLPEPSFRLLWKHGEYKVTRPNIDDCDCYSTKQMHAHAAAVSAAKDARIKVLEDQLRLALAIIGHPDDDITKAMRAALGDKT